MKKMDYYEFLQISPNAEEETIHRVYRFLAARYHPDNPDSGNAEKFSMLTTAYEVLSNHERRAEYDARREKEQPKVVPMSRTIDFMDHMEGENNRRVAVLAVLYFRRRTNPHAPEVPLAEVEARMGFPRDYLDFTTWYLQKKGYIMRADNSDFTLTAQGVDYVETQRVNLPILNKLLTTGEEAAADDGAAHAPMADATVDMARIEDSAHMVMGVQSPISPAGDEVSLPERRRQQDRRHEGEDRRVNKKDRRVGLPDTRVNPIERRMNIFDRRRSPTDRRTNTTDRRQLTAGADGAANLAASVDRLIAIMDQSVDEIYGPAKGHTNGTNGNGHGENGVMRE
jgi:curved DNA-binding protein CbpA